MNGVNLDYPRAVLVALGLVTAVALVFAAGTSTAAFGIYNPAWDGAADLRGVTDAVGADHEIVRNTNRYTTVPVNGTLVVILSPERGYGPNGTERIRRFVREGGTLLLAEDSGAYSNDLLAGIGAETRIDGRLLRDERYNYRSPAMPVATNVSNHMFTQDVNGLTLNYGTAVRPNGATVLATTSGFAYQDVNRNGQIDPGESLDTYPVATVEQVDDGRIIVVGDPSLFINTMLDRPGNQAFVRAVFSEYERVLLDYSHAGGLPPLALTLLILRETPLLQAVVAGVCALSILGWARYPDVRTRARKLLTGSDPHDRPGIGPEELVPFVRRRHPDWDEDRIERLIQEIISQRQEDEHNE